MANPTTIANKSIVVSVTTTVAEISVVDLAGKKEGARRYGIKHDGEDNTGAASTVTVYGSYGTTITATAAEGSDKFKLMDGDMITIPAGTRTIKLITASGSATVTIFPLDS